MRINRRARPEAVNARQVGGQHYKAFEIEPWDFCSYNKIPYLEADAIVYIARWRTKGGLDDLRKAIHHLENFIEVESNSYVYPGKLGTHREAKK